jgi:hypothetical protein
MLISLHERHALPVPATAATLFNAVAREALNLVRRGDGWFKRTRTTRRQTAVGRSRKFGNVRFSE